MNKPSDTKVRQAIEDIFSLNKEQFELSRVDTGLKSRTLLRHWPLSRVERLVFRSDELPSVILKAVAEPMQGELATYQDLFSGTTEDERNWTPRLYGHTWNNHELWLFLEDLGTRTLKNDPTPENLNRTVVALASMHVSFGREVANGSLQQRSHLSISDYSAYISGARQGLVLTRALVNKNIFTRVTNRHLAKLEAITNMYDRVAIGLVGAPQTLVHGDYNADNIALEQNGDRVYILDWANAHIGPGLLDLVDLTSFATAEFGPEALPKMLHTYRTAYRSVSGEPLEAEPFEELLICSQIEKKMSLIRWFCQCSLKWIPSGAEAYNFMVAGLIEETYELSTVLT
jgi:hypothetical protein